MCWGWLAKRLDYSESHIIPCACPALTLYLPPFVPFHPLLSLFLPRGSQAWNPGFRLGTNWATFRRPWAPSVVIVCFLLATPLLQIAYKCPKGFPSPPCAPVSTILSSSVLTLVLCNGAFPLFVPSKPWLIHSRCLPCSGSLSQAPGFSAIRRLSISYRSMIWRQEASYIQLVPV